MSVLKNKRRTSKIEYERNFLGFYEYMNGRIDHMPRRWMRPLGRPMKDALNQMYDDVLMVSEMYIDQGTSKKRYMQCKKVVEELMGFQEWMYLYWILSDGRNGIKWVDADARKYMSDYLNREIYLLGGVMRRLDPTMKLGRMEVTYMKPFNKKDIEGVLFLEKLCELNELVYPKHIRIPTAERDEEVSLACRYIRNAFFCAYDANILEETQRHKAQKEGVKNMSFYKVIKDGMIVGVCTDDDFRRFQAKHSIIVVSGPDGVEAVDSGGTLYHDTWMAEPGFPCEPAAVTEITVEEYDDFKAQLEAGGVPDDGSLDEEQPAGQEPAEAGGVPDDGSLDEEQPAGQEPAEAGSEEGGEEVKKTAAQILREQIDSVDSQVKLAARFASV